PYKKNNQIADVGFTCGLTLKISQAEFTVSGQNRHLNYDEENTFYTERVLRIVGDVSILF
ncbi:TPA: hypothetical protein DCW38_06380, partial [candidate division WOR-3 bacterium]|nr:hypothetical protein [candidate division WOR-3 bacterium]